MRKETGDPLRMGKGLIIYGCLGLLSAPSSEAGSEMEEEGGSILPPLPRHPARNRSQHPVSLILQSMRQRTKPEMKP